jgi:hypothetical protein
MQNNSFILDTEHLTRAARTPLIISVALGLTWLFRIYLGYLYSPALTFLEAFAGAMYMKSIMDSGKKPLLINAGLNGAVLGGLTILVYAIISWITGSIVAKEWSLDFLSIIFTTLEGGFVGFLGALAWYAYKTHTNN